MQIDFHYYMIYALVIEAGYTTGEASTIAYASQFTDDNSDVYNIKMEGIEKEVKIKDIAREMGNFNPLITQLASIKVGTLIDALKFYSQKYVYAPFHFIPAGYNLPEITIKELEIPTGYYYPFVTYENCQTARDLVASALRKNDIYLLGIALHIYADTWSHSRFSGFHNKYNDIVTGINKVFPDIGHFGVTHDPDVISKPWNDSRFGSEKVENDKKALKACKAIFMMLTEGKKEQKYWNDIKGTFEQFISAENDLARIDLIKQKHPNIPIYDDNVWIKNAFDITPIRGTELKPEFKAEYKPTETSLPSTGEDFMIDKIKLTTKENIEDSDWYRFQIAAKKTLGEVIRNVEML